MQAPGKKAESKHRETSYESLAIILYEKRASIYNESRWQLHRHYFDETYILYMVAQKGKLPYYCSNFVYC